MHHCVSLNFSFLITCIDEFHNKLLAAEVVSDGIPLLLYALFLKVVQVHFPGWKDVNTSILLQLLNNTAFNNFQVY